MPSPQMVIRIVGDTKELQAALKAGESAIVALGPSVEKMAANWSKKSASLVQDARNIVAAVDKIGASTLTTGDAVAALKKLEAAMAQLERSGQPVPAQMRATADALRGIAPAAQSATSALLANASAYVAGLATFETAKRVLGGFVDFLTSSVEEASKAEAGQKRLETAMKTAGVSVAGNMDAFASLAEEMQRTTTVEDDQVTALIAMGLQLGVLPSQMDGAVKAAANLSAGLKVDLETAMRMIVKANNESFTAFGKLGIAIDEARAKAEGLPYVLEQINKGVGGQAAAEVQTYAGQVKQLANEWGNFKETLGGAILGTGLLQGAMATARLEIQKWQLLPGYIKGMLLAMKDGPAAMLAFGQAYEITGGMAKAAAGKVEDGGMAVTQALADLNAAFAKLSEKATKQFTEESEAAAEAYKKSQKAFLDGSKEGTAALLKNAGALNDLSPIIALVTALDKAQVDQLEDLEALYNLTSRAVDDFATSEQEATHRAAEANYKLAGLKTAMTDLGHGLPAVVKGMDDVGAAVTKNESPWNGMLEVSTSVLRGINNAVAQTASLILNTLGGAIKAFAKGDIWGGLAAIGAGVVGVLGQFWGKISKAEGKKVNDLRDTFFAAAGGFEALHAKLIAVGAEETWQKLWNAKTVKDWEAGVAAAEKALADYNTELDRTKGIQSEIDALQKQLADYPDWKAMQAAAEKYGIDLANLGPQFQSGRLHDGALQLLNDYELLTKGGGDVGSVLTGMAASINTLVQDSVKFGVDIPENMRPMLEALAKAGQLVDANGNKITDLSQLKFGAPLVTEVDKIIAAIKELVDALQNKLMPQITGIPKDITVRVGYKYDPYNPPDGVDGGADNGGVGMSRGGVVYAASGWPSRGTDIVPAMLTPGERVLTVAQNREYERAPRSGSSGQAPLQIAITIQALDPIGLKQVVEREVAPLLVSAYRRNVNGLRTDTRKELVD